MTRHPQNQAFAQTSFLSGANAGYIEEMQALYEQNPGSVSDEWRLFFQSLQDGRERRSDDDHGAGHGPAWAVPLAGLESKSDLVSALSGDYGETEQAIGRNRDQRVLVAQVFLVVGKLGL